MITSNSTIKILYNCFQIEYTKNVYFFAYRERKVKTNQKMCKFSLHTFTYSLTNITDPYTLSAS